jgi:hypothetical protein
MLLGLLRDGLVTQLSHAGYLGEELAKAQTALQFGLRYDQDRPLRQRELSASPVAGSSQQMAQEKQTTAVTAQTVPRAPRIQAFTLKQLESVLPDTMVDLFLSVTDLPREQVLGGILIEPDETGAFRTFGRTPQHLEVQWTPTIRFAMGGTTDLKVGALLRVVGKLDEDRLVHAEQVIVLTSVAQLQ